MAGPDVAFGGVDPEQVAEVVVERDAVGESRPDLVSTVVGAVAAGDTTRKRHREVIWQRIGGPDLGPLGPQAGQTGPRPPAVHSAVLACLARVNVGWFLPVD